MLPVSIVIITKNESRNIAACIQSAQLLSNDIIVVDCGSTDGTIESAKEAGAKVLVIDWQCYGHSRNAGADAAKHDWILALDADERITPALATALQRLSLADVNSIYKIKRENYYLDVKLQFGTPGFEKIARLYNRNQAKWNLVPVHEKLVSKNCSYKTISQSLLHFGIPNETEHVEKKEFYAFLSGQKYFRQGKKATLMKRFLSPAFNGLKSYVFQLGFLDGKGGWRIAKTIVYYTWLKYKYLYQLTHQHTQAEISSKVGRSYPEQIASTFFAKR